MSYQNDVADFMKAGEQPVRSELSLEGDQATPVSYTHLTLPTMLPV